MKTVVCPSVLKTGAFRAQASVNPVPWHIAGSKGVIKYTDTQAPWVLLSSVGETEHPRIRGVVLRKSWV